MTVLDIIQAKSAEDAQAQARRFGANFRIYLIDKYGSLRAFMHMVYKTDAPGRLYPIFNGEGHLTDKHFQRMIEAGANEDEILALYDLPMPPPEKIKLYAGRGASGPHTKALPMAPVKTPDAQPKREYNKSLQLVGPAAPAPRPPPPPPPSPDQFALIVGQDGRATLRLNLVDIPMKDALRTLHSLTAAGILRGDTDT